jgi:glycosyltransferase involved in cell wall biosynthesis
MTMNILMSYNSNEGHGALGRYKELTQSLLNIKNINIFYISPQDYSSINGDNFHHLSYKRRNFRPNFLYAWTMISIIFFKNFKKLKSIDKCVLFNGLNSFLFAFFKVFFKYEIIYSVRVNIILNGMHDNSQYSYNYFERAIKKIQFNFYNYIENYIVSKADKIVFQSDVNAQEYKKMYTIDSYKIHILHNNCNPSWVGGKKVMSLNKGFNIAFVGNLFKNKGLGVLLKSFKLLNNLKPNSFLTIIGDGPDRVFFENTVTKLAIKNTSFKGYLANAPEFIHNFDLIVVPSFMEAFPNVVLEAIYYNVPVLGSKVGGIPIILEEEFLFESNNHEDLFKKIILLTNKVNYKNALQKTNELKKKFLFDWGKSFYNIIIKDEN